MRINVKHASRLKGEITVAADKSISHRAVILSALAEGEGAVKNLLVSDDTMATCRCLHRLGIDIKREGTSLYIKGKGLQGFSEPKEVLDCGNSGTTMRLLTGLLAAHPFFSVVDGDTSLNLRPMLRVIEPLREMGAQIWGREHDSRPPLGIKGGTLKGINYRLPIASAQVKSALLLAGLTAEGRTVLAEPFKSRDHTERMLAVMGADIQVDQLTINLNPGRPLIPQEFIIPGDISSAAFFLVAASILPGSEIQIKDVGINPTRNGIITVLERMGAKIKIENQRNLGGEILGDIIVTGSHLRGITVEGEIIPQLIDELPILAVAMATAQGESRVKNASELRVKETDRIAAICSELSKMGAIIEPHPDGFTIKGNAALKGSLVESWGDHRIAMSLAVAALVAQGETTINNCEAVNISFPTFWNLLFDLVSSKNP